MYGHPSSGFQKLLTFGLVLAIGTLVFQGIAYQGRWNAATVVQGDVIDVQRTDMSVYLRTGERYRELLSTELAQAGAGLWVRPDVVPLYELEGA